MGFLDRKSSIRGKSKPPVRITTTTRSGANPQTVALPNDDDLFDFNNASLNKSLRSTFDEETTDGPAEPSVEVPSQQPRRMNKKKRLGIAAVILVLLALTIGLAVGLSGRKGGERGDGGGGGDTAGQAQTQEEEDDDQSSSSTTSSNVRERSEWEIQAYLLEVLSPHTPMDHLLDATRPQGHAFSALKSMEQAGAPATADATILQRYALLTLFLATNGLFGWTSGQIFDINNPDYCSWNGVECSTTGAEPVVTSLKLDSINLEGTIPDEVCLLGNHLETLVLVNNDKLSGAIPTCFVKFGGLQTLDLSHNDLTGIMPLLGYSPNLVSVNVSHNRLTGQLNHLFLPTNSLPKLQELYLNANGFTGPVPSSPVLARQTSLATLELTDNQLTGVVSVCSVDTMTADCAEVMCNCCSNCQ